MFLFIVILWIFLFNKCTIQNHILLVQNVMILSSVYATLLWAKFYVTLWMSSTNAVMNAIDKCDLFDKAVQLSVIVRDNKFYFYTIKLMLLVSHNYITLFSCFYLEN
jgi:hypothetical protein